MSQTEGEGRTWAHKVLRFEDLRGLTMDSVENHENEEIVFTATDGRTFKLYHAQDCCESVMVEDVVGDLTDLVGVPLLMAEEAISETDPEDHNAGETYRDSFMWTFYKLATIKGYVTIRWYGESNGYYSVSVDFAQV